MGNKDLKQEIIKEIKRVAEKLNLDSLPKKVFFSNSNIWEGQIQKNFGSWNAAVQAAGLTPIKNNIILSDEQLFEEILRVCNEINAIPTRIKMRFKGKHEYAYRRRFGSWDGALQEFKKWLIIKYPESELIEMINTSRMKKNIINKITQAGSSDCFVWQSKSKATYGMPINFRGLRHEPINEQGVVFLFGMISEEIGFSIELIRTGYPDCEGKRRIDKKRDLWEQVLIEFEYKSSNFKEHCHDPKKCDLIICWKHDWTDCPLEVIELKEVIKKLK